MKAKVSSILNKPVDERVIFCSDRRNNLLVENGHFL